MKLHTDTPTMPHKGETLLIGRQTLLIGAASAVYDQFLGPVRLSPEAEVNIRFSVELGWSNFIRFPR